MLKIKDIDVNSGQIPGLPANPRLIRDQRFEKLKRSITDFPEMLSLREIVVVEHDGRYVCLGGNMRLIATKELGHKEIPAKVVPADWPIEKLAEFVVKDNTQFGEDDLDILANQWTDLPLDDWGMELPGLEEFTPNLEPTASGRVISPEDIIKTQAELDAKFKDSTHSYSEVTCPSCAETFYINTN